MIKIKIGLINHPWFLAQGNRIQDLLMEHKIEADLEILQIQDMSPYRWFPVIKEQHNRLLYQYLIQQVTAGNIDVFPFPLAGLEFENREKCVPAALLPRDQSQDVLLLKYKHLDPLQDYGIRKNAVVKVWSNIQKAQLHQERPDLDIQLLDQINLEIDWNPETEMADALLLPQEALTASTQLSDAWVIKPLIHSECTPMAGQGVVTLMTLPQNHFTRKTLQKIHHATTAECTNLERSVAKSMLSHPKDNLGIYCQLNLDQYYQVWAKYIAEQSSDLKYYHTVSPTKAGLLEEVISHLI